MTVLCMKVEFFPCFLFLFLLLKELSIIIFKIIFKMTPSIQKKGQKHTKDEKECL